MDALKVIKTVNEKLPDTNIIFSNIIPRGEYDLDIKRQEFNLKMLQKSEEFNFKVNDNSNLSSRGNIIEKFFASDKIHLSEIGTKIFALVSA